MLPIFPPTLPSFNVLARTRLFLLCDTPLSENVASPILPLRPLPSQHHQLAILVSRSSLSSSTTFFAPFAPIFHFIVRVGEANFSDFLSITVVSDLTKYTYTGAFFSITRCFVSHLVIVVSQFVHFSTYLFQLPQLFFGDTHITANFLFQFLLLLKFFFWLFPFTGVFFLLLKPLKNEHIRVYVYCGVHR